MNRKKKVRYITIRDTKDSSGMEVPEGSSFVLTRKTKHRLKGIWPGMCFTVNISVPKKDCKRPTYE